MLDQELPQKGLAQMVQRLVLVPKTELERRQTVLEMRMAPGRKLVPSTLVQEP